jgi:hypothetical protein
MPKFDQFLTEQQEQVDHLLESVVAVDTSNRENNSFMKELGLDITRATPQEVAKALSNYFNKNKVVNKLAFLKSKGFSKINDNDIRLIDNLLLAKNLPTGKRTDGFGKVGRSDRVV